MKLSVSPIEAKIVTGCELDMWGDCSVKQRGERDTGEARRKPVETWSIRGTPGVS